MKEPLSMSNGGTSVFISVMALAGSHLAQTDLEIEMATWIGSVDQGVLGLGVVGFDLTEMPWSTDPVQFSRQQAFLQTMIERVKAKTDFHLLDYDPPYAVDYVETFSKMLTAFNLSFVNREKLYWPLKPEVCYPQLLSPSGQAQTRLA